MLAGSLMIRPSWVASQAPVEHSTGSWVSQALARMPPRGKADR